MPDPLAVTTAVEAHLWFWAGYAAGVLSTCAGAAGIVYLLIRRAPYLEYERDGDVQQLYVLPGQRRTVVHVGEPDPPDPLPLRGPRPSAVFYDEPAGVTSDQWDRLATDLGLYGNAYLDRDTGQRIDPDDVMPGWFRDRRPSSTEYRPGVPHHDLDPTEWPDGTVTYHTTTDPDPYGDHDG